MCDTANHRRVNTKGAQPVQGKPYSTDRKLIHTIARQGVLALFVGALVVGSKGTELAGGGWIPSLANDGTKATYGFDLIANHRTDAATPAPISGSITLHDRDVINGPFPKGVNVSATSGFMWVEVANSGVNPFAHDVAITAAPCTFAQGGNGGSPG